MGSNIGLNLESSEDNRNDSEENKPTDWGIVFSLLKNRGFSHQEILSLSYPQLNAYMKNINNPLSYQVVIPYMGDGKESKTSDKAEKVNSKEEIMSIIAEMNREFGR